MSQLLIKHVESLLQCERCPDMHKPVVSCGPVNSRVMLVGQAPGVKEPQLQRPFAWTAGKTLFSWFEEYTGMDEARVRQSVYMTAVCRCYPGKNPRGGDRVPNREEIENCSYWLNGDFSILKPQLVIAVGKLAIQQFVEFDKLLEVVGRSFRCQRAGQEFDLLPLPHPSGLSTWPRMEPGKTLLKDALLLLSRHPAMRDLS